MPAQITHKCLCFSNIGTTFYKSQRNSNAKTLILMIRKKVELFITIIYSNSFLF